MKSGKFSIAARLRSFPHAFRGLYWMIKDEHNSRIHLAIAIILVPVCFILRLSLVEWAVIVACIGLVLALELINSALERISDKISPGKDPEIGKIKDIAAGAVLIGAITSAIIGLIILLPKLMAMLQL